MDFRKWESIFKLVKTSDKIASAYSTCDWICTEFATDMGTGKPRYVLKPLQKHPFGEEFGLSPSEVTCYIVTRKQLEDNFEVQVGRNYWEEQQKYKKA